MPPVSLPRRMWAGGALSFHSPLKIGEEVTRRSVVDDVVLKQGQAGPLCFVTVTHRFSASGRAILTERQDIVYLDVAPPGKTSTRQRPAATPGDDRREIAATPELLFRYSALTFNSHRIHYDQPYATDEEGYPGLVVHGPLQAMLLIQYAAELRKRAPVRFSFRSLSSLFAGGSFFLNASEESGRLKLWTAGKEGPVAMEAYAEW